ncbi:hypothetical protein HMPREF1531_00726 [Propionibacterium sp. oral taxon 192 str. F0372]|uniref:diol dehydratase small subunit n=1 Tax=Propionibacterium sp. oral taxon 192 TaxID=671222 RepID=UPI000353F253|nr:diol dehydratase small subunit [Propionibacterium sp. oral taxon 192]EPH06078.1 hypothetical protein HMPREF1531_00726 [Propionibacterium sp. oral taxon 192 str. F0372]
MDQESLIRQIMGEVLKNLDNNEVSFTKTAAPAAAAPVGGTLRREDYPLAEKHADLVTSNTGKALKDLTFADVKAGRLSADDFKISADTLEKQAQIADAAGRPTLGRNFRRAAELISVPDERVLEIYNALRPYRSTKAELYAIAEELEGTYGAKVCSAFVREAADEYERRGRLRED